MKANTVKLAEIFGAHTRYRVPLFQRPYVWQKDKQWQPLWDDLREVAERQTDTNSSNDDVTHFMGAIVVDQEVKANGPASRLLIDGQQRLTTLQLVIAAARVLAARHGDEQTIARLEAMLFIPDFLLDDPRDRLSLVPTNYDRAAFAAAVELDGSPAQPLSKSDSNHILSAYAFFKSAIAEWLAEESEDTPAQRLRALAQAMWDLLRVVVIALEHGDDAQAIFETLNARGTPLLAADLVKNYLFRRIETSGGARAAEQAYAQYWARFDQRNWREEVGQGRARRPRIDILLTYWLVLEAQEEVNFQAVFDGFRRYAKNQDPSQVLARLDATAAIYESFDALDPYGIEGTFFHRVNVLETTTFMPVVLWMFGPYGIGDRASRQRALGAIESWLVRRMLCRMTTKNYNTVAIGLLKELSAKSPSGQTVVDYLLGLEGESQRWPDDSAVREAVRSVPYYTSLTRRRLRMVLDAIEAYMHDARVGPYTDRDRLTIEHVLPQSWESHWPLPASGDALQNRIERDAAKHRLGNLALATQALNSTLSHAPWVSTNGSSKREALRKYSQYLINKDVIDEDEWDEGRIAARGETFTRIILALWPKPPAVARGEGMTTSIGQRTSDQDLPTAPEPAGEEPWVPTGDAVDGYSSPSELPDDVGRIIARYPDLVRHLAIQLAKGALTFSGTELRGQKSKHDPTYFQVRHPRFSQVVAYVSLRDAELIIEYRLPQGHPSEVEVERRSNFYGIRYRVRRPEDLSAALTLLDETLSQGS